MLAFGEHADPRDIVTESVATAPDDHPAKKAVVTIGIGQHPAVPAGIIRIGITYDKIALGLGHQSSPVVRFRGRRSSS